jgi:hypothetical protein
LPACLFFYFYNGFIGRTALFANFLRPNRKVKDREITTFFENGGLAGQAFSNKL